MSYHSHPVTQRLFWMLRVVTSLFIGAVILGECEGQLPWAAPPSCLSHRGVPTAAFASGWTSRPPFPHLPHPGLIPSYLPFP